MSLLDTDLALMAPRLAAYHAGEPEPAPSGGTDSVLVVYQPFSAADRTIVIAIGNDAMWLRFCEGTGLSELAADPELRDNAGRRAHRARVTEVIAARIATRPAAEWLKVLGEVDVPAALVQSLSEVVADSQVVARASLLPVPGSAGGLVSIRSPFRLDSVEVRNDRFPGLGADTRDVLSELGYAGDELADLVGMAGVLDLPESRAS